jgi:hypothetical protein
MRITLESLPVVLMFAPGELDQALAGAIRERQPPALKLSVVAVAAAQNFGDAFDQLQRILVDAAQDERAPVAREREANPQLRFAASSLSAVEQLVGIALIGGGLRPVVGRPQERTGGGYQDSRRLVLRLGRQAP